MKTLLFLLLALRLSALEVLTEARVAYFIPTDAQFRSNYGEDGIISSIETSFHARKDLYPWINISYYGNAAHPSIGGGKKSHIYYIPIGAGLKYLHFFDHLGFYAGVGVLPAYVHIQNNSPDLFRTQKNWGCGGVGKIGFIADRLWNCFLDLFAEYSYIKIPFQNNPKNTLHPANLTNFSIGGAIGYHFGARRDDDS